EQPAGPTTRAHVRRNRIRWMWLPCPGQRPRTEKPQLGCAGSRFDHRHEEPVRAVLDPHARVDCIATKENLLQLPPRWKPRTALQLDRSVRRGLRNHEEIVAVLN